MSISKRQAHLIDRIRTFASGLDGAMFGVLFGSAAMDKIESDVDIKFYLSRMPTEVDLKRAGSFAKHLDETFGRGDPKATDIPYERKVLQPFHILVGAISLQPFALNGCLEIPLMPTDPALLQQEHCQMRIALNLLTTPHSLAVGSVDVWNRLKAMAAFSIRRLIYDIYRVDADDFESFFACAVGERDGRAPTRHLGYKPVLAHREWLRSGIGEQIPFRNSSGCMRAPERNLARGG